MKLTEHLEHVINLVERHAPYLEIKSSLLAMHEEVQGTEQAAAKLIKLSEENPTPPNAEVHAVTKQLLELQSAVLELQKQLNQPPTWLP